MDNYYDGIAEGYEELHGAEQLQKLAIIRHTLTTQPQLKGFINPSDSLLDVGCGTGIGTAYFDCARRVGIDPSAQLIARARKGASSYSVGCAEKLPFFDHEFDVIISLTAIQNFDDIKKGLSEIKRVGKKRFILTVLQRSEKYALIDEMIKKTFTVIMTIAEEKDMIYFCT